MPMEKKVNLVSDALPKLRRLKLVEEEHISAPNVKNDRLNKFDEDFDRFKNKSNMMLIKVVSFLLNMVYTCIINQMQVQIIFPKERRQKMIDKLKN